MCGIEETSLELQFLSYAIQNERTKLCKIVEIINKFFWKK